MMSGGSSVDARTVSSALPMQGIRWVKEKSSGVRAVLFDYDDTLEDVGEGKIRAKRAVATRVVGLAAEGDTDKVVKLIDQIEIEMDRAGQFDKDKWWIGLLRMLHVEPDAATAKGLTSVYYSELMQYSRPFPDVAETLGHLKSRGLKLGLVTNTDMTPGMKKLRLKRSGIQMNNFDVVVIAGEDTVEIKPNRAPFIFALDKLRIEGPRSIYVGDKAYADVGGARAAGMWTALVKRNGSSDASVGDPEPDVYLASLSDLMAL